MNDTIDREVCCKNGCDNVAVVVLKIYLDSPKPAFLPFCMTHLLDGARAIEGIVATVIGVNDKDKED